MIENAEILAGLAPGDLDVILSRASQRAVPNGTFLFRQGEPASEMFLLESGRVRLYETTADGREVLVRFVRPGEVFGDRAAIPGSVYGGTAVSNTPVRTHSWTTAAIVELMDKTPRLARNLFAIANRYLHYSRERHRMLATAPAERRIHWALKELARSFGLAQENATSITGQRLQQDIADLGSATIYTVNRVLRGYERRGMLTRRRGRIVLLPTFQ